MRNLTHNIIRPYIALAFALGALANIGTYATAYLASEVTVTETVNHKERIYDGKTSKWLVFTDGGEYEVVDSLLYFDWRSSSRYNSLEIDKTCTFTKVGWRLGVMSMYPNIVEVESCDET